MSAYTHYYTQNKIKEIPNGLIKDIKQLFKNLYKDKYKEIDKTKSKKIYTYNDWNEESLYIVRLNNKKIYIKICLDWFIIDINRSNKETFIDVDYSSYYYEIIIKILLMLCVYYGVIKNEWQDDRNKINETLMNKCKKELIKLGFSKINYKFDNKNKSYYTEMIKK